MSLRILITGGTIDDLDYEKEEDRPKDWKTHIPNALEQCRVSVNYEIEELMGKDSRFVTDKDQELILESCKSAPQKRIVITHGTMRLPETAKYLGQHSLPKTIILVGAAKPINKGVDGYFNLGAAITASQTLPHGVYVCMNGRIFTCDNVQKNFETGYFEKEH